MSITGSVPDPLNVRIYKTGILVLFALSPQLLMRCATRLCYMGVFGSTTALSQESTWRHVSLALGNRKGDTLWETTGHHTNE